VPLSVAGQGDREVVMTRVFAAPRRLVFEAWTKPELLARGLGPRGWTTEVVAMDVRAGGAFHYVMRGPDGGEIVMRGTYREVVPPERLVTAEAFEGFVDVGWRPEDATVTTATFVERDGQTTWTATIRYPSQEVRDAALGLKQAWNDEGYQRLDELLAELA
jgi:uncharacterized protein YndB with AHSA1/START domain